MILIISLLLAYLVCSLVFINYSVHRDLAKNKPKFKKITF